MPRLYVERNAAQRVIGRALVAVFKVVCLDFGNEVFGYRLVVMAVKLGDRVLDEYRVKPLI